MVDRFRFRSLFISTLAAVALFSAACKKTPPAAAPVSEPPAVQQTPPEPVREMPMRPVVEERAAPVRSLGASDYNAQGILKTIYFDFDRHEVRPDQRMTLEGNATHLKADLSSFNVLIEGHCDERGTNEYNMALGDQRANAARQYLVGLGIPAGRIRTISYGEERPSDAGHNEEPWARNRRADFVLEEN